MSKPLLKVPPPLSWAVEETPVDLGTLGLSFKPNGPQFVRFLTWEGN